jgi:hypothetical protein
MAPKKTTKTAKQAAVKTKPKGEGAAPKEFGIFDFITAVSDTKRELIRDSENPEACAKLYSPFMTNKALSFHVSSIIDANIMNECGHVDPQLQFDYLLNSVRKEKRFSKWFTPEANEDLDLISEHYQCNKRRAEEILSILTKDQIEYIRSTHSTGGAKK